MVVYKLDIFLQVENILYINIGPSIDLPFSRDA
jgi:hypothetical protein